MSTLVIKQTVQYKTKEDLLKDFPEDFSTFAITDLIKTDTYNEEELIKKIKEYKVDVQRQLLKCALHIALIGSGKKNYGKIMDKGEIINVSDIFKETGVSFENEQNKKLTDKTLTARRLVRIFRYQIQKYLVTKNEQSYLFKKYSDQNEVYRSICFPGAEHLVTKKEDAKYLLEVYKQVDIIQNTKFCERLKNIFRAREIIYE